MDKNSIREDLKKAIVTGKFDDARTLIINFSTNELSEVLCVIADDTKSIIVYTFICYLLIDKELPKYHIIAAEILSVPLFSIPGAYNTALYHVKRALELDPDNIYYKESLLFFYSIPDRLISRDEALEIAREIIKVDPTNVVALDIISEIMGR